MTGPWPSDARFLQLADLTVDLRFRRLIHSGQSVELPQRIFDLLLLFLAEPDRVHTRTELFDRLWAGTIVEDSNLSQNIWLLRKALGEARKNWVRTVAKSGYVFESPGPLQWFQQLPSAEDAPDAHASARAIEPAVAEALPRLTSPLESIDPAAVPVVVANAQPAGDQVMVRESAWPAVSAPPQMAPIRGRYLWGSAAAALVLVCVVVASVVGQPWRATADRQGRAVAIVAAHDQHDSTTWATTLLEQWLSWKLDSLSEVNLIAQSDLAAGGGPSSVDVVFLSSERLPDAPERIAVYARLLRDGKEARFEAKGDRSEAPALIDSVSRQVVAKLMPKDQRPWPTLEFSARAAERYAQAADARRQRDWMAVARIGAEVVAMAPRFGLMRLQLAEAQAELYNSAVANAQMQAAVRLLAPVPAGVDAHLQAKRLALDPASERNALEAYSSLIERYPEKAAYRLEQVRLLLAVGRPKDAQLRLAAMSNDHEPVSVRIAKDQYRADAYRMMGELDSSRALATAAEKMLRELGPGWTLERADAMLTLAMADTGQHPERGASPWYGRAADLYDQAGNSTRALHSRFLAQMTGPPRPDGDAGMDELLATARAGGYRRLEIMALMASAGRLAGRGDIATYRTRLQQSYSVAETSGDVHSMRQIGVLLLDDLIQTGQFADADVSIARLRNANLQTGAVYIYGQRVAKLAFIRGRYQDALSALGNAEELQPIPVQQQADTGIRAGLNCSRADILIELGRLPEARQSLERCAKADYWFAEPSAILSESRLELVSGDRRRAAALLEQAEKSPVMGAPSQWAHLIGIAAIAVRLGDTDRAERIYAKVLPELQPTGYTMLVAAVRVGQAESAATRGVWALSRSHSAEARKLLPSDAWSLLSRLDLLEAWDARARGDMGEAAAVASRLHREARRLGDVAMELQVHRLLPAGIMQDDCSVAEREALIAKTGGRSAGSGWPPP
ncbi:winged helix-turn-helix domain-containing protein [Xanthomonas hortorum]|uniref:winged helix-turn-helix domain-containing protein n=1 Tax=Xanthomonas hortorum TaxID=56454 RepID=UPI001592E77E|nr:winged helix-turn-helix domain-containing protein [Xanthomonas hortorum]NHF65995.1 hypothetical protein [Xanthomonas hortorum]